MEPNAIETKLTLDGQDVYLLKEKVIAFFKRNVDNSPAKVFPVTQHSDATDYPNSPLGIPQFKLHVPKTWVIVAVIPVSS